MSDKIKVVGRAKQKDKDIDATHSQICQAATEYMRTKYPEALFIHIPNEGKRSLATGKRLKAEGMLPGTFDYFLGHIKITPKNDGSFDYIPGAFVEIKTKKDRLSKTQKEFRELALKAHYSVCVVHSIDDFMKEIDDYMGPL